MTGWAPPAWTPPRVGAGQGWTEDDYSQPVVGGLRRFGDFVAGHTPDETEEERQRRERWGWNPTRRLEEQVQHTRQNPLTLPADVIGMSGELLGAAAQYPLGVAAARDSIDALREAVMGPEDHGDLDRLLEDLLASAE